VECFLRLGIMVTAVHEDEHATQIFDWLSVLGKFVRLNFVFISDTQR
jgi:hypothetical protein